MASLAPPPVLSSRSLSSVMDNSGRLHSSFDAVRLLSAGQREMLHRCLSLAVASLGLILAAPVMIVVAAAVRLSSPGPIFFSQTRVGIDRRADPYLNGNSRRNGNHGGRPFTIFKFRTMYHTNGSGQGEQVWAEPNDPRVTAVGRFLRRFRLDELPQLYNVLRGDMNVVGPRPEQPDIFASMSEQLELYPLRQRVRPGITGLAQVNHHYDRSVEDVKRKVAYDLEYLTQRSLAADLGIMLKTIPTVLTQKGAW